MNGGGGVDGIEDGADMNNSQDPYLKYMADHFEVTVVSIGYRLAPEDPWPAGAEDCYDAAEWLVKNGPKVFGGELMFTGGEVCVFPSPSFLLSLPPPLSLLSYTYPTQSKPTPTLTPPSPQAATSPASSPSTS